MKVWSGVAVLLLVPSLAWAQRPAVEIGTHAGVTFQNVSGNGDSETLTQIGVPGGGILGQPTIYFSFFPSDRFMIEPELAFNRYSSDGDSFTTLGLAGWLTLVTSGVEMNSLFVSAGGAMQYADFGGDVDSDSDTEFAAGARIGYRAVVREAVAIRFDAGYRRWFDSEVNEFGFGVGIGVILKRGM